MPSDRRSSRGMRKLGVEPSLMTMEGLRRSFFRSSTRTQQVIDTANKSAPRILTGNDREANQAQKKARIPPGATIVVKSSHHLAFPLMSFHWFLSQIMKMLLRQHRWSACFLRLPLTSKALRFCYLSRRHLSGDIIAAFSGSGISSGSCQIEPHMR